MADQPVSDKVREAQQVYKAFMRLGWGITIIFTVMFVLLVIFFNSKL